MADDLKQLAARCLGCAVSDVVEARLDDEGYLNARYRGTFKRLNPARVAAARRSARADKAGDPSDGVSPAPIAEDDAAAASPKRARVSRKG